jgi:hypothetical protein
MSRLTYTSVFTNSWQKQARAMFPDSPLPSVA